MLGGRFMYNEYENYMRSILGYPSYQDEIANTYFPYRNSEEASCEPMYDNMYPEIYKMLKPMIKKACDTRAAGQITQDLVECITDEIYKNIEPEIDVINVNVTTENDYSRANGQVRSGNNNTNIANVTKDSHINENRTCCSNPTLRDLIKILLLNQMIGNKPPRPNRPRPPFPPEYNPWYGRPPYRSDIGNDYR